MKEEGSHTVTDCNCTESFCGGRRNKFQEKATCLGLQEKPGGWGGGGQETASRALDHCF